MARGKRPDPFRTRKLSLSAPMVLPRRRGGRVGRRRTTITERGSEPRALAPVRVCPAHFQPPVASSGVRRDPKRYPEVMTSPRRGSGGAGGGRGSGGGHPSGDRGRSGGPRRPVAGRAGRPERESGGRRPRPEDEADRNDSRGTHG